VASRPAGISPYKRDEVTHMADGRILVVDDEETIRTVLSEALEAHGYRVRCFANADQALRALEQEGGDLVLVDLKLPGSLDGLALLDRIVAHWQDTIVIVLTGYASLDSAIAALRRGAYDYLTKPASIPQILESVERGLDKKRQAARRQLIIAQLEQTLDELRREGLGTRGPEVADDRFVKTSSLMIDRHKRLAVRGDQPIALTATEFDLLEYLAQHADRVVTPGEIVKEIQGYDLGEADARPIVRVHIQRLRQKLEDDPDNPKFILNVRGKGYRFLG
jgi:two-component system KDP operon response regulator KdpE